MWHVASPNFLKSNGERITHSHPAPEGNGVSLAAIAAASLSRKLNTRAAISLAGHLGLQGHGGSTKVPSATGRLHQQMWQRLQIAQDETLPDFADLRELQRMQKCSGQVHSHTPEHLDGAQHCANRAVQRRHPTHAPACGCGCPSHPHATCGLFRACVSPRFAPP